MTEALRFAPMTLAERPIIEFPHGLIGLPGTRYALVEDDLPVSWLQGLDDSALSIPVTNPFRFFEMYTIELSDHEAERLAIGDLGRASTYVTVRYDHELGRLVLNLRAPIVVVGECGYQVINQAPDASLRAPIGV